MNELSAILNNLNKFTTAELETMVQKFPYFQQGHLLLAKKYQQEGNTKFDQQLQLAALYTHDRELLYNLFKDADTPLPEFISTSQFEENPTLEIPEPELPSIEEEPVIENKPEVIEEEQVLTPVIPQEELEPGESELASVEQEPVVESETPPQESDAIPSRDGIANDSSSINELIIDIEDEPEVKEEEPTKTNEREAVNEFTLSPLDFGDEEKTETIDEAPVMEEELGESPPVQQQEEILTPLIGAQQEKTEPFAFKQPHTFDEWLKMYAQSNVKSPELDVKPVEKIKERKKKDELNELIVANPSDYLHQLVKEETSYSPGLTKFIEEQIHKHKHVELKKTADENDLAPDLLTETMAKIYEMQKKYEKAIHAYEVLRLKFPEKNDTFAARIDYLKSLL